MNYTEHEFNGKTNHLSLTAGALYTIYERFGYTDSIISTLQLDEQTLQGWHNCCWLYALLAAQGELQRRALGYEARPMISMEALQKLASPADVPGIKNALFTAIRQGFTRCVEPTEEEEVDLVLREIELDEKKKEAGGVSEWLYSLVRSASSTSAQPKPCSSAPEISPISSR